MISVHDTGHAGALGELSEFRERCYRCLTGRADALFELGDAVLCGDGPVTSLAELSLAPQHRRGHGAGYDAIDHGHIEVDRLRTTLAGLPLPRAANGRIVLAVDVSSWLRPGAACSPERLFCHVYGRSRGASQLVPGWSYSFVGALETGRTSWTAVLDAVRLGPTGDATAVTATQLREVVGRIIDAGHWHQGDPSILIVADAGYDVTRLAFVLADLPIEIVGRIRSDRVMLRPAPLDGREPLDVRPSTARCSPWQLAFPRPRHGHRHHPLRTCPGTGVGPVASAPDPSRTLAGP